jgi:hypothetical protein
MPQAHRPGGKEFRVFHRLGDTGSAHSGVGGYIDGYTHKGQHTVRKGTEHARILVQC